MKDNTPSLEVKEDGQIWLNDGRQSILVSDQEVARELLFLKHCIFPKEIALKEVAGIYPIPGLKWEVKEEPEYPIDHTSYPPYRKVAVISLPESPLIGERSAEEMTLQQCKEKIAKLYGFDNWDRIDFYMLDSQDQTAQRPYAEERLNDEVAELYASQFKAFGEWISVWDKNPETKGHYLTVNLERDETPFVAFYNTVEWRTDNGTWTHPTHWQPLPSPPRIEKQTI